MSDCIGCGEPNGMADGKTKLATFDPAGAAAEADLVSICRDCCRLAAIAWARKDKGDNQPPPTAPAPTSPPTGATAATVLSVAA